MPSILAIVLLHIGNMTVFHIGNCALPASLAPNYSPFLLSSAETKKTNQNKKIRNKTKLKTPDW